MITVFVLLGLLAQATPATQPLQPAPGNPVVLIETSMGTITIELFQQQAPASVENFLKYVQEGFYPGTIFHRVVSGYVIQGGGYTADLNEKAASHPPVQNEATNGLSNQRGTVAMARTRALRSATSQFYINLADNRSLDHTATRPTSSATPCSAASSPAWTSSRRDRLGVHDGTSDGMENVPIDPVPDQRGSRRLNRRP